ncbi:MAG: hypothetical protein EB034_24350 [Verrucomicrobia bacterium]|nr:hypothetical protein [Verrucomicrobiota bacterium]
MMNDLERYLFINRVGPNTESLRRFMQDFISPVDDDTRILSRADLDMPPLQETEDLVLPSTQSLPVI